MKPSGALIWKEWREAHVYLWIGLGVFLFLPLINGVQEIHYRQRFIFEASGWITLLGGMFAVLLGVGLSCRDLHAHLEDFWRSRPIPVGRWLAIKYTVGLLILLICCVTPAVLEWLFNKKENDAASLVVWFPFLWIAIFSLSFFIGTLLRRTAQTSLIAVSAMLLLYLVPVILPPLRSLSITAIAAPAESGLWGRPQVGFAVGMCLLSALFIALAFVAVKRAWQLAVGRKMLFGSVVLAVVLLLLTTAFQLGTNMPVVQSLTLPTGAYADNLSSYGGQVLLNTRRGSVDPSDPKRFRIEYRRVAIAPGGPLTLSSSVRLPDSEFATSPTDPNVVYQVVAYTHDNDFQKGIFLRTINLVDDSAKLLPLRPFVKNAQGQFEAWQLPPQVFGNRLYIPGDHLIVLDIAKPQSPQIVSETPWHFPQGGRYGSGVQTLDFVIPPAPGLSDLDQLRLAFGIWGGGFDGQQYLIETQDDPRAAHALELYKLQSLSHDRARFIRIAERKPPLLESIFLRGGYDELVFKGDKIYALQKNRSEINAMITVFSVTGPHPLQVLGHFGAPHIDGMLPLEDGRCLITVNGPAVHARSDAPGSPESQMCRPGGADWNTQLLLLGPPPSHD